MSKYFDKLLKIDESLTKELKDKGLYNEDDKDDTIEIPKDSLTDDQKKDILLDKGVEKDTVDNMKQPEEIDTALNTTLNTDETKAENESAIVEPDAGEDDESNENVYVRIDDEDLDLHGYIGKGDKDFNLVDDEKDAQVFTRAEAANKIAEVCDKYHYDYNTFNIQDVESQVDDDGENWVSIDSSNPSATVIP